MVRFYMHTLRSSGYVRSMESIVSFSMRRSHLIVSCILLSIGVCGGPLISRLYFIHGGKRLWFSAFLQNTGFIITAILLLIAFLIRGGPTKSKFLYMKSRLFFASVFIGLFSGLDAYLYAYGWARLPVSTSALINSSQLVFIAIFAYFMVKQTFTSSSINAVVLLTMGAGVLAMHTSGDRPEGETKKEYMIGFVMTIGAAALYGFGNPFVELTNKKANQPMTYTLLMEFQMIVGLFATIFCFIGMLVNNDHKVIPSEAKEFGLGETRYYVVVVSCVVVWQCFTFGEIGVICYSSSLLSGIIIALLLPVTEVLAIIFYREKFQAEKGVALFLSLWGFVSYFYGEFQANKNIDPEIELSIDATNH